LDIPNLPLWQRDYLQANCIFVNLEHKLYIPAPRQPSIFNPPPRIEEEDDPIQEWSPTPGNRMEGPSRIPNLKGKGRALQLSGNLVYLEDLLPPGANY
jgi:hypothetical protein